MFKALFSFIMYHISSTYVLCPNPSLGCLPPKSNRRQCSRLCSVLWCIIFLQHVLCPNPTLGCLPPKSDRRQCSRLCSVLLCMSVLSHASPFVAQNISPPTQYAVSFIGSPFWRQTCSPPPPWIYAVGDRPNQIISARIFFVLCPTELQPFSLLWNH